jgi:hypothetical protein
MRLAVVVLAWCVSFAADAAPKRRVATTVHKSPAAIVVRPPTSAATKPTPASPSQHVSRFERVTPLPLRAVN